MGNTQWPWPARRLGGPSFRSGCRRHLQSALAILDAGAEESTEPGVRGGLHFLNRSHRQFKPAKRMKRKSTAQTPFGDLESPHSHAGRPCVCHRGASSRAAGGTKCSTNRGGARPLWLRILPRRGVLGPPSTNARRGSPQPFSGWRKPANYAITLCPANKWRRHSQVVRRGSAKPLCVGSIPTVASEREKRQRVCPKWIDPLMFFRVITKRQRVFWPENLRVCFEFAAVDKSSPMAIPT